MNAFSHHKFIVCFPNLCTFLSYEDIFCPMLWYKPLLSQYPQSNFTPCKSYANKIKKFPTRIERPHHWFVLMDMKIIVKSWLRWGTLRPKRRRGEIYVELLIHMYVQWESGNFIYVSFNSLRKFPGSGETLKIYFKKI